MGLSASQGRMLLLTARKNDLEYRAQQISQKRLVLSQQLESIALDYEDATSNRQMTISLYLNGDGDDAKSVTRTGVNLTYAFLMSGTKNNLSDAQCGINRDAIADTGYHSNVSYRLVDADGAIVVSSEDEIPGESTTVTSSPTVASDDGIYRVTDTSSSTSGAASSNYIVLPKNEDGTATALSKALQADGVDSSKIQFNSEYGTVKIGNDTYSYLDGTKITDTNILSKAKYSDDSVASIVSSSSEVPMSKTSNTVSVSKKQGGDGKWRVEYPDGSYDTYIVDKTLARGASDINATAGDGPNYLQDCLRNGKYLLQKFTAATDTTTDRWSSISWDATTNIADSYYTDDDDAAKAKYDRLQTQIQNQDKKLELELDNIETQRSAVTTEVESVQKVIDDNIESSFKAFA